MTRVSLAVLVVMTSSAVLVCSAPTPAPSPQFPFTVLPPKGTSFRQPYRPFPTPKEYYRFIRGLNYIKDLIFPPAYSSPIYSSPYDSYISSPYYSSGPSFNGYGYDADDSPSQYYYKR